MSSSIVPQSTNLQTKISAALHYIEQGWPTFILGYAKTPLPNCNSCRPEVAGPYHDRENCSCLTCHGFYAATLDKDRITRMIEEHPVGMLALRTGGAGRLLVIDAEAAVGTGTFANITGLDVLDAWETWVDGEWELPTTLRQRTGSGGLHLVYRIPKDTKVSSHNRILPQIDVKAEFGYIAVWSGEGNEDGRHWISKLNNETITDATPQMLAWLADAKGRSIGGKGGAWGAVLGGDEYENAIKNGATAGEREGFFARLSFDCFIKGMDRSAVEALMYEHWLRCEQPLGNEFPWHWVEYKILRDSVNVKSHVDEIPAWRPSTSGLGNTLTEVSLSSGISVIAPDPNRPDLLFHFSDTGLGERYAKRMRNVVRYNPVDKMWYVWNDAHWVCDTYGRAMLWTKEVIKDIYVEAAEYTGEDEGLVDRLLAFAREAESMPKRMSMLKAASLEEGMVVQPGDFDADPWLLVLPNGTLELKTQTLRESRPVDLNTKCGGAMYDPNAKCPNWINHINFLTSGDTTLAAYLQRVAGYALTGLTNEQKFFFFEGKGANGKNVFIEPLLDILGSYALRGSTALITGGDEQHPTIIMQLLGKRLVFVDEAKQGRALNVERIKELTGSKKLNARGMNKDPVEFDARLKLLIAGNNHPKISDTSDGTWRRMQRIMCENRINEDKIIKDYARILFEEEGSGILNWCLEGLKAWQEPGGLGTPKSVLDSVAEYRSEEDLIGVFLDECCVVTRSEDDYMSCDEAFATYQLWAAMAGFKGQDLYNKLTFGKAMVGKDLPTVQKKIDGVNARRHRGVKLLQGVPNWRP